MSLLAHSRGMDVLGAKSVPRAAVRAPVPVAVTRIGEVWSGGPTPWELAFASLSLTISASVLYVTLKRYPLNAKQMMGARR